MIVDNEGKIFEDRRNKNAKRKKDDKKQDGNKNEMRRKEDKK